MVQSQQRKSFITGMDGPVLTINESKQPCLWKKTAECNIWHSTIDCVACLIVGCDVMMRKYSIFNFLIWNLCNHHGNSSTVLQEYFPGLTTNNSYYHNISQWTCYEPGSSSETSCFGYCLVQCLELKQKHSGDSRFSWFTRFTEDLLDLH